VNLIDSNVFMYAAGSAHPRKAPCNLLLQRIAASAVEAAVDTEVLQELLHRYRAIRRWKQGRLVYDLVRKLVPSVLPITVDVTDAARNLMDEYSRLMARDALHAAVVIHYGLDGIVSLDRDFDVVRGLRRLEPPDLT